MKFKKYLMDLILCREYLILNEDFSNDSQLASMLKYYKIDSKDIDDIIIRVNEIIISSLAIKLGMTNEKCHIIDRPLNYDYTKKLENRT